ncbi:ATP-dependent DNA ligase [Streptomyces sp. 4N509B]|uniref:ATP-dependent DNA ligase n=1 Tax=Streptomyces sp. 4N509B TaxID=3457413 RepID=UPI003FD1E7E2
MLLAELAQTSREVAASRALSHKTAALARLFADAGPEEAPVVITYLSGRLPQRRLGVGWAALRDVMAEVEARGPAPTRPELTVLGVDAALERVAAVRGAGSGATRRRLMGELFAAATAEERDFLARLVSGELRQGALDALAVEGLAAAVGADPEEVRRAVMLGGSLGAVARAVLAAYEREAAAGTAGATGAASVASVASALGAFRLEVGRPVRPMLAQSAKSLDEALDRLAPGAVVVEEKLDGIRVQVHREGEDVRIYTRTLDEITGRLPEVRAAAMELGAARAVLDGEVIALDEDGRPRPFQETAGRVGTLLDEAGAGEGPEGGAGGSAGVLPLFPVFFDLLAVGDRELLELPAEERHAELARLVPAERRVRRVVVDDPTDAGARAAAREFAEAALARGHEGVMVKALAAPYGVGRRGGTWLKVKPVHTLDLVVLAAEWGHGRRAGRLSNLHLGARRADGSFAMLGKTFKGLTDAVLEWQTERLLDLAVDEGDEGNEGEGGGGRWGVRVRPELVVEIAFDGVQRSTRYPEGVTLRFARVVRYREDKAPSEVDTVETVRALLR